MGICKPSNGCEGDEIGHGQRAVLAQQNTLRNTLRYHNEAAKFGNSHWGPLNPIKNRINHEMINIIDLIEWVNWFESHKTQEKSDFDRGFWPETSRNFGNWSGEMRHFKGDFHYKNIERYRAL